MRILQILPSDEIVGEYEILVAAAEDELGDAIKRLTGATAVPTAPTRKKRRKQQKRRRAAVKRKKSRSPPVTTPRRPRQERPSGAIKKRSWTPEQRRAQGERLREMHARRRANKAARAGDEDAMKRWHDELGPEKPILEEDE